MTHIQKIILLSSVIGLLAACTAQEYKDGELKTIPIEQALSATHTYSTAYDIDSNEYKTIKIGDYEWFAQNLRTTKLNDGTELTHIEDANAWALNSAPAYTAYKHAPAQASLGLLYNHASINTEKICPEGWSVPDDEAWHNLAEVYGGKDKAGENMKSVEIWNEDEKASNKSGFSAIPAGFIERTGKFYLIGDNAFWWSASEHNSENSKYFFIDHNISLNESHIERKVGLSIRCVKK